MFVEEKGIELITKNLYKNLILHLCNLSDFGLLNASALVEIVEQFDEKAKQYRQQQKAKNESIVKQEHDCNHF